MSASWRTCCGSASPLRVRPSRSGRGARGPPLRAPDSSLCPSLLSLQCCHYFSPAPAAPPAAAALSCTAGPAGPSAADCTRVAVVVIKDAAHPFSAMFVLHKNSCKIYHQSSVSEIFFHTNFGTRRKKVLKFSPTAIGTTSIWVSS